MEGVSKGGRPHAQAKETSGGLQGRRKVDQVQLRASTQGIDVRGQGATWERLGTRREQRAERRTGAQRRVGRRKERW